MDYNLLSDNRKTKKSINYPICLTCSPTKICAKYCYARKGHIAMPAAKDKQQLVYDSFLLLPTEVVAERVMCEYFSNDLTFLRWCGSGDLFPEAVKVLNFITENYPNTVHWVVTRKPELIPTINAAPNLYINFSLDNSSEHKIKKLKLYPKHTRMYFSYLRTDKKDDTLDSKIIFNLQQKKRKLPYDNKKKCCPVDAGAMELDGACEKCRKCFSPRILC